MQLSIPDRPTRSSTYEEKFLAEYKRLNIRQKEAVDTLQGPVLVVAGPGTGKTQVLSLRIANLLRNTDDQVAPHNILCLTYTDNAAGEMHHRLADMIGPAAHGLKICTFHAFCNDVIQAHPQHFGRQQLELVTDLEYATFMEQMLDALPVDHVLKKLKGKLSFDAGRLRSLFEFMKREDVLVEDMQQRILEYINDLPNREEFIYKRKTGNFVKGDLKVAAIRDEEHKMRELHAAVELYHEFEKIMRRNRRYDYADMILWVIDAFKKNPDLAAPYREQYRYILVDEYQDTSGAQNEILQLLTEDDDDYANVFCVGDDDQSIYEFQGARIRNILDFATRYDKNLRKIVLVDNYRSTQQVLDCSRSVIDNNQMRLVSQLDGLVKNLHAVMPERVESEVTPQLLSFENQMHEEAWVASKIEALIKEGTPAGEIAVLYKNHRQATNLIEYFAKSKIPYCVKREMNVLEHPVVEQLVSLLQYVNDEAVRPGSADGELFRIMHFRSLGIDPRDLVTIAVKLQENDNDQTWREALNNTAFLRAAKLHNAKAIERLGVMINRWVIDTHNVPLRLLAERVLADSGLLSNATDPHEGMETLEALTTFFSFLHAESERRTKLTLKDLSDVMRQMEEHGIKLPLARTAGGSGGVAFNTCHGAKGSEFLHVFLIGCTCDIWDKDGGASFKFRLPPTVTFAEGES
ncbi:MAG TPA: ATP-dependent helicase, partial [Chitinophagales bacterium]|nr:ATP-dependent helicase [Chitinophagales bacterium]